MYNIVVEVIKMTVQCTIWIEDVFVIPPTPSQQDIIYPSSHTLLKNAQNMFFQYFSVVKIFIYNF